MSDSYITRRGGSGGSSSGGGGTAMLTVEAPANINVEASKGEDTLAGITDNEGKCDLLGLSTGEWSVTISDPNNYYVSKTQTTTITADYSIVMDFFDATINITYPAGSACTVNGPRTLTAPDTSGTWKLIVPSAGDWTITITDGSQTASKVISVTADGQVLDVVMNYFAATIAVTYPAGSTCTCSNGEIVLTAADTSGSYTFVVPSAGSWIISCTNGTDNASNTVSITTDGQSASVTLDYKIFLFKQGDKCTSITGGYTTASVPLTQVSGSQTLSVDYTSNPKAVILTGTIMYNSGEWYTAQQVDLTNINTITAEINYVTNNSADICYLCCFKTLDVPAANHFPVYTSLTTGYYVRSINVSNLTGKYYVGIMIHGIPTCKIDNIYMKR